MKQLGIITIISLAVWWLTQRQKQAQASGMSASELDEYEKLHTDRKSVV